MDKLKQFRVLFKEGEERDTVMCAAGAVAEAVGKDAFHPYVADAIRELSMASIRAAHLRECSLLLGVLTRALGDDRLPHMSQLVPTYTQMQIVGRW